MPRNKKLRTARLAAWGIVLVWFSHTLVLGQIGPLETDPSLKLWFNFDQDFSHGEVVDASGNGNNGWQFDPTNWITSGTGVFGSTGAQFTYVGFISNDFPHIYEESQYIAVTNANGFAFLTNATISFWARIDTNGDVGMYVMDTGYNTGYSGDPAEAANSWSICRLDAPNLSLAVFPSDGSTWTVVDWPRDVVQPGGYTPNLATTNFHLYSVTIDCPNSLAIAYHDGVPCMTNYVPIPWLRIYGCPSIRWLSIGAMAHNGTPRWGDDRYPNSGWFAGRLDDIRIYNRTLSAAEIASLYSGSTYARNLAIDRTGPQTLQLEWTPNPLAVYQVEYLPDLSQLAVLPWTPLGSPIPGSVTNRFNTSVTGQTQRLYRARVLP